MCSNPRTHWRGNGGCPEVHPRNTLRPRCGWPAFVWSAGLPQRGLDLLTHDPGQLVPRDQQLLTGGLLPKPVQDPPADQHARKLPARLGKPPQRSQGISRDPHAVNLRPATRRLGVWDEPRRIISGSPPLEVLVRFGNDLLLSLRAHRPALPNTRPAACGPLLSRCRRARLQSADARSCRSTPAAPAAPTASSPAPPPTLGRCHGAPTGSGPGPPRWPTAAR